MNKFTYLIIGVFLCSCSKTPDPNYFPKPFGDENLAPWDAPSYSYETLLNMFPDEDYSGLNSVYVAKTGSDENGDGSAANPYASISFAIDQHNVPGTIIRVHSGVYNEKVTLDVDATKDSPFVVYSEDGPGEAKIDNLFVSQHAALLNGQFCVLDGFEVYNSNRYCISIFRENLDNPYGGGASYGVVRNCIAHDSKQDVVKASHCDFVLIEKNDLSGSLGTVQEDQCIDGVAVYHTICRYNYLHDNGSGGGGYFKAGSHNNIWCYNYIVNMIEPNPSDSRAFGILVGGGGQFSTRDQAYFEYPSAHDQLIFNNVMVNCSGSAVTFVSAWNCKIYNNTFVNCGYEEGFLTNTKAVIRAVPRRGNGDSGVRSKDCELVNNVSYNEASKPVDLFFTDEIGEFDQDNLFHSHNSFYSVGNSVSWNYPGVNDPTEKIEDPQIIDLQNCDYSLSPGSPCIDAGKSVADVVSALTLINCPLDFFLTSRPQGAAFDRGAYEQ